MLIKYDANDARWFLVVVQTGLRRVQYREIISNYSLSLFNHFHLISFKLKISKEAYNTCIKVIN